MRSTVWLSAVSLLFVSHVSMSVPMPRATQASVPAFTLPDSSRVVQQRKQEEQIKPVERKAYPEPTIEPGVKRRAAERVTTTPRR